MNGVLAVAKREFRTFFASPIAYIVLGGFLLVSGWLYFSTLLLAGQASLRNFFGVAPVLFVVLVPAITMRSVAEERKSGTLELLLTMPLDDWQIVVGKFLASLGMVGAVSRGSARYTLTAPIAGVVTQRGATIGRLVDADDTVFEVVDPSVMWIDLDVPESELALVAIGQTATVVFDGLPRREFSGAISYLAPAIDTRTRTALARVPLGNADGALRVNAFGRGRIAVTDPSAAVLVPRAAVQRARDVNLVFVRVAEDVFEGRRVIVGPAHGDLLSVVGRVEAGDDVVTDGSFLLKTETLKESIGAGCCEVN